jgi:hypothetical protein
MNYRCWRRTDSTKLPPRSGTSTNMLGQMGNWRSGGRWTSWTSQFAVLAPLVVGPTANHHPHDISPPSDSGLLIRLQQHSGRRAARPGTRRIFSFAPGIESRIRGDTGFDVAASNSLTGRAASGMPSAPSFERRGAASGLNSGSQFLVFAYRFSDCIVLGHDSDQGWTSEATRGDHGDGGGEPQWGGEHCLL